MFEHRAAFSNSKPVFNKYLWNAKYWLFGERRYGWNRHKSNIRDSFILMELNNPLEKHNTHKLARNTYKTVSCMEITGISSQV